MSEKYEPEKGDRVRVVIEGEVDWIGDNGFSVSSSIKSQRTTYVSPTGGQVVSIQRLADPLPTTPGSVIRSKDEGAYFFRILGGNWRDQFGALVHDHIGILRSAACYDVIFDAGAAK